MPQNRVRPHVNPFAVLQEVHFDGFENENPIVVDVGACKGEFVFELSQKFPEKNFIALEIRVPLAEKLKEKFKDILNIRVFDGDAGKNFRNLLEPSLKKGRNIETIYVNFPDPWFKERHKKRRFINLEFLDSLSRWINSDVEIIFQTDQESLFNETVNVFESSAFNVIEYFDSSPHGVPTDWEEAKLRDGDTIYRMKCKKSS